MTSSRRPTASLLSAAGVLVLITACGGSSGDTADTSGDGGGGDAAAAEPTDTFSVSTEDACAAAADEGGVVQHWATTDAAVFDEMIQPFKDAYPDITVEYTALRPNDAVQQVLTLVQTGRDLGVDSIAMSVPYVGPLLQRELIRDVDWEPLGIPADQVLDVGDEISLYRNYRMVSGLVYNADLISEDELPDTWEELVDPKWDGKIVVDPRGTYLSRLAPAWGEDETVDWYTRLMETAHPLVVQGATASLQKVAVGEALMSTSAHDSEVLEQQAAGAPLEIKYLDLAPTQDYYSFIMSDAAHPNAAACFLAWYASDEGQAQQLEFEFKGNDTAPADVPDTTELVNIETEEDATMIAEVGETLAGLSAS